jgi:hypothetical protein
MKSRRFCHQLPWPCSPCPLPSGAGLRYGFARKEAEAAYLSCCVSFGVQNFLQHRVSADDEEVADAHDSEGEKEADSSEEEDEEPQTRSETADRAAKAGAAAALDQHLGVNVGWVEDDEAEAGAAPVAGESDRPTPMSSNHCFFVCGIRLMLGIKYDASSTVLTCWR